ncbi:hypothetical protein S245_021952 [Arachis hypogaea]
MAGVLSSDDQDLWTGGETQNKFWILESFPCLHDKVLQAAVDVIVSQSPSQNESDSFYCLFILSYCLGKDGVSAAKVAAVAHPLAEKAEEIASNISYHAQFSPHFSPLKFELEQAYYATAESVRDRFIREKSVATISHMRKVHCEAIYVKRRSVSCLSSFSNLEKLDLKLNNLTSLEVLSFSFFSERINLMGILIGFLCMVPQGLRSCVNLKLLSVLENKLETLEGIQGLTKLTVLDEWDRSRILSPYKKILQWIENTRNVKVINLWHIVGFVLYASQEEIVSPP